MNKLIYKSIAVGLAVVITLSNTIKPIRSTAAEISTQDKLSADTDSSLASENSSEKLHAFYPSYAVYSEQIKEYIDQVDSVSFAWSRIDAEEPGVLNTVRGKNGNWGFYYPSNYAEPVEYVKGQGKSIQLNVYMDGSDGKALLPYEDRQADIINAILTNLQTEIIPEKGIYYDGVVIDFEGLRNTDSTKTPLLYDGKPISVYFTQFLSELKNELSILEKKLYVAVNPGIYFDGYDYGEIISIADRVILMAHDYEPTERLTKSQVNQYTGYDFLKPIDSMAPILKVREALNEIQSAVSDSSELSKVWLQLSFDSAQWQFDAKDITDWEKLDKSTLSRKGRGAPLYKSIKARVDNTDGYGQNITYGYNNELYTPYIQYYNSSDQSWNVILYEGSKGLSAKIELAKIYGLGGISLWSLSNVPDYTDSKGVKYQLDGWTTILEEMETFEELAPEYSEAIAFMDPVIEQAVRDKIGKTSGEITVFDLQSIYRLKLPKGVMSLTDLKHLKNLEYLNAQQSGIKDITTIGKLTKLRVLYLQRNQISNITPLSKLKKLEVLSLNGNQITNLKPLAKLTSLTKLYLTDNKITDIGSLKGLTGLRELYLKGNKISDYSPVKKLVSKYKISIDFQIK